VCVWGGERGGSGFKIILGPCKFIGYEVQKILIKYLGNNCKSDNVKDEPS